MTTVAWRDGILAADSQGTLGSLKSNNQKLWKLPDGGAIAFCGDYSAGFRFVESRLSRKAYSPRQGEDFQAIIMKPEGSAYLYENGQRQGRIRDRFYAIGSGAMAANGAMAAGATARGAVQAAAQFDCFTGGRIKSVKAKAWPKK